MKRLLGGLRQILDLVLVILVVAVLGTVIAVNLGPSLGHQIIVIRGGSMEPAIGLGSAVDVVPANIADVRPGDVVTVKALNGVLVTHRVVDVVQIKGETYVKVKGDANASPDDTLAPASSIVGRVDFVAPYMGIFIFMLTIPTGIISIFLLAFTLLLTVWLLEDLEGEEEAAEEEEEGSADVEPSPQRPGAARRLLRLAATPYAFGGHAVRAGASRLGRRVRLQLGVGE